MRVSPSCASRSCIALPTPQMTETGWAARKATRLRASDRGKAARLVEIGRDLCQKLVVAEPDRDGDADLVFDAFLEARQGQRRRRVVHPLRAGQVEKSLVDRERLDRRRQRQHQLAHFASDAHILRHVRRDDHGVRAGLQRLEHRHRRAHAERARDIACRRHDAALSAAHDHRPVGEARVVALLHRRVEGVAIDMRDRERKKLRVRHEARAAALGQRSALRPTNGQAIAAERDGAAASFTIPPPCRSSPAGKLTQPAQTLVPLLFKRFARRICVSLKPAVHDELRRESRTIAAALQGMRIGTGVMPKTVMIVEDNELNMKLFNDLLRANGYATLPMRNGYEALDALKEHRPDLIIMDIQLPEISGLEVTKRIKQDEALRAIPVIAVTAFAMKGDEERIRQGGCEGYLSKPISVASFIADRQIFRRRRVRSGR